jgi:hypothetical protein
VTAAGQTFGGRKVGGMSVRSRVLDWAVAIIVAVGVVASIPMIPLVAVGWLILWVRSPMGGWGVVNTTRAAANEASSGKLQGFSGAVLFPMVVAGWFLIALLVFGLTVGDEGDRSGGRSAVGLALFLIVLIVPTFLCYRSMNPKIAEVPLTEWLGSRNFGQVGIPLVTWAACVWLVWSITTWTTFLGTTWTTICSFVLVVTVLVLPGVFLLVQPRGGRRLYWFIGVASVIGLVTAVAYQAGLTLSRWWP